MVTLRSGSHACYNKAYKTTVLSRHMAPPGNAANLSRVDVTIPIGFIGYSLVPSIGAYDPSILYNDRKVDWDIRMGKQRALGKQSSSRKSPSNEING